MCFISFFKQKTAYEMRISDWSSDVCSSDLLLDEIAAHLDEARRHALFDEILGLNLQAFMTGTEPALFDGLGVRAQTFRIAQGAVLPTGPIGRASCRERVWQYG